MKTAFKKIRKSLEKRLKRRSRDEINGPKEGDNESYSEYSVSTTAGGTRLDDEKRLKELVAASQAHAKLKTKSEDKGGEEEKDDDRVGPSPAGFGMSSPSGKEKLGSSTAGKTMRTKSTDSLGGKKKDYEFDNIDKPEHFKELLAEKLPRLTDVLDARERTELFQKKLFLIRATFQFKVVQKKATIEVEGIGGGKEKSEEKGSGPVASPTLTPAADKDETAEESEEEKLAKLKKTEMLVEIADFVSYTSGWFNADLGKRVIESIAVNLFRPFPPSPNDSINRDFEDEEVFFDPAWIHLQHVYEILLRLVGAPDIDSKLLKKVITRGFVCRIISLFASEDAREREYVKNIVHRIYGRFMSYRSFIRKTFRYDFISYAYEDDSHHGIAEILEIVGSIVNGFALPVKDEHKEFLFNCLMPLHKSPALGSFQPQLCFCVTQYIEKEPSLAEQITMQLVSYWPVVKAIKEVFFLNEIEEVLQVTKPPHFAKISKPLFDRISKCILSNHFQVSERALFLWNDDTIISLCIDHREQVLPRIISALITVSQDHWSSNVQNLALNVLSMFKEVDLPLYNRCLELHARREADKDTVNKSRSSRWAALEAKVKKV